MKTDLFPDDHNDAVREAQDYGPLFVRGSDTSEAAAKAVAPGRSVLRERVLRAILCAGPYGLTDEEMQHALEMNPSTQRPRRGELVREGLVVDSGRRRLTTSKRAAVVWIAEEHPA